MNALLLEDTLTEIVRNMRVVSPHRKSVLFNEFLLKGYALITLNSVPNARFAELLRAKVCLGSLITLYDDFADRPAQTKPGLLDVLYQVNFGRRNSVSSLNSLDRRVLDFAHFLFPSN